MSKYLIEDLINDLKDLTDEQRQMEVGLYDESDGYQLVNKIRIDTEALASIRGPNNIGWVDKKVVGLS